MLDKVIGEVDLSGFEYMIVYSEKDKIDVVNAKSFPSGIFQLNYDEMVSKGYIIHAVYKRLSREEIGNEVKNWWI